MQEHTHQAEMLNVVGEYLQSSLSDEGVRERAGERMKRALLHSFIDDELPGIPPETATPTEAMQSAIMAGYIALVSQVSSVHECEYYFRRYPFRGIPISKGDHLRNCCEIYFDRIVQFRDRLKALLNACKKLQPDHDWRISSYLKTFDRTFASVIRARNHTHHHGRYDDDDINQLALM
jgi:hypothetical protein